MRRAARTVPPDVRLRAPSARSHEAACSLLPTPGFFVKRFLTVFTFFFARPLERFLHRPARLTRFFFRPPASFVKPFFAIAEHSAPPLTRVPCYPANDSPLFFFGVPRGISFSLIFSICAMVTKKERITVEKKMAMVFYLLRLSDY